MNVRKNISSFTTGEISPRITARVDLDKYHAGCEVLENFLIQPQGGVTRRPGTRFVADSKYGTDTSKRVRLIRFQFNVTDAYVIEMGHLYLRFYKGISRIESGGNPVEVATPYTTNDIWDVKYAQSADVMYLVHPSYPPKKLSRTSDTSWTLADINFLPPPSYVANTDLNVSLTLGATSGADVTFTAGLAAFLEADVGRAIIAGSGRAVITEYTDSTHVQADIIDAFSSTSYSAGQWYLTGSPVATCRPRGKAPVRKTIYLALEDPDATEKAITSCSRTGNVVTVTCNGHGFQNNDYVSIYGTSARKFNIVGKITNVTANTFDYNVKGGSGTPTSSTGGKCVKAVVGWRSADVGKYVKLNNGVCKITQYTNVNDVNNSADGAMVKAEILSVLDYGSQTPAEAGLWSLETPSFSSTTGYPSAIAIYQQRLWLASTSQQPQTIWGSVIGDYENFSTGTKDDNAVDFTLSTWNRIRWLSVARHLVVGTYGEEITLGAPNDAAITPTNIRALQQTSHGSSSTQPIQINNTTIFVQRSTMKLREFIYDWESDAYNATDLTVLAEHITRQILNGGAEQSGIVDMAYQNEPDSTLWLVRGDGALLSLTYQREHGVMGWARHITGDVAGESQGWVESVATVPVSGKDRVWVVVQRKIGTSFYRYIEYFEDYYWGGSSGFQCNQLQTDSAKVYYNATPQTVYTGLSHLEGKSVNVIGDGKLQTNKTVSAGQVTIDTAASYVEIGLPYVSRGLTVRPEVQLPDGTAQGRVKGWSEIVARLYKTMGGYINDEPMEFYLVNGVKTAFTGDYKVRNLGYDEGGRICFEQYDPLPFTLLSLSGKLSVE